MPPHIFTVYVDMVGDLAHFGHQNFFKEAIAEGERLANGKDVCLIVGLHSDEDCSGYKRQPTNSLTERVATIAGFKLVDAVFIPAPLTVTDKLLDKLHVDRVVHGDDISEENKKLMYSEPIKRGIMSIVPYTTGISTTEIRRRLNEERT